MRSRWICASLGALGLVATALALTPPAGGVVGGRPVAPGEFPYVVELTSPTYGGLCTASLIHPTVVLTAAHCATVPLTTDLQVRIGNDVAGSGGEIIPVKQIILHPDYAGGPDDLALLRLQWPSTYRPVRLAQPNESAYWDGAGDYATALGWGFTDGAGTTLANRLQRATVKVLPDTGDPLGNMRITLDDGFNTAGPCQGDSGGPLLVQVADGTFHQAGVMKAANCGGGGWYSEVGAGPNHTWVRSHIPDLDAPIATDYTNTVYALTANGDIECYRHAGYTNGAPRWVGPSVVGTGAGGFSQLFMASGAMYGVQPDGSILWYRHDGFAHCGTTVSDWTAPEGKLVGTGWTNLANAFGMTGTRPGTGGVMYTIDTAGNLRWVRHLGWANGGDTGADWQGGTIVGTGWNGFRHVFGGEDGHIYAIDAQGQLFEYFHLGWLDGSASWAGPHLISVGWTGYPEVTGSLDGVIYGVNDAGHLIWFEHLGHQTGTVAWEGPFTQGADWDRYTRVMVHSFRPPTSL
jgi:hypothetical protein